MTSCAGSVRWVLWLTLFLALSPVATFAQESDEDPEAGKLSLMTVAPFLTPIADYRGSLLERTTLFGDPGGYRQALYEKGIALDFGLTQVPQGVVSGGTDKDWEYGASADYSLFLDSGRLGLWPGGLVGIHAESKFGSSVLAQAGSVSPVNGDFLWPEPGEKDETFLSEYYLWQGVTEWMMVLAGRVNWVALADRSSFANNERTQFMNMSLRNTPLLGAFVPLSAHGVAVTLQPHPHVAVTGVAVSQNDEPGNNGSPGGLFDEVTLAAEIDLSWEIGGLPGAARPAFAWGSKDLGLENQYFNPNPFVDLILLIGDRKNDNWLFNFNFEQYLYKPEPTSQLKTADFLANPEGIGVFLRFAYSPENRNPWNQTVSGGIGGRGLIPSRPNDRYGIGFYAMIESGDFNDQLPAIGSVIDTEWGMEIFYNIAITPWLQLTPDFQYIDSGIAGVGEAVVLASRVQIYF
jgi:porin